MTECTGGPEKLLEHDLPRRYTTYCDPRLNYAQGEPSMATPLPLCCDPD